jgi:eukaryotic-like serine/threonine-protein kinase
VSEGGARGTSNGAADRIGQVLGEKYRLVRLIGEGGMGAVYEALHLVVKRRFAVKLLRPERANSADVVGRFRREAEAAGALENEHIVAVTDFGKTPDGVPYLVMEYLLGESVGSLLAREGPLPVPRAVSILLQVCRGLEVAHAAGIVHRDLKPDNLFIVRRTDRSDLVKILDFGIAKLQSAPSESVTRTGSALGTPFYMAPEQARGDRSVDRRADVYALGVILYELLSFQKPHPGDSYNAILAHILTRPPIPLDSVRHELPDRLVEIVHGALAFEANERPQTASVFAAEITQFAGREITPMHSQLELRVALPGAPTVHTPDTVASPVPPAKLDAAATGHPGEAPTPIGRQRNDWLLLAVAALAAAIAAAMWLRREPESQAGRPTHPSHTSPVGTNVAPPMLALPTGSIPATFGSAAERSIVRSENPRAAPLRSGRTAPPKQQRSANPAVSASPVATPSAERGARFDPKNPYQ